jgi:hypothetical protein
VDLLYDAATNRLTTLLKPASTALGYDVNGNMTPHGTARYYFDAANRLIQATGKESYAERWRQFYNEQRPHSAHRYKTPASIRRNWNEPAAIPLGLTARLATKSVRRSPRLTWNDP